MECIVAIWVNIAVMLVSIDDTLDLFAALEMYYGEGYILAKLASNLDSQRVEKSKIVIYLQNLLYFNKI